VVAHSLKLRLPLEGSMGARNVHGGAASGQMMAQVARRRARMA